MTRELEQTLARIKKETPEFVDGAEVVAGLVKTLRKQGRLPEKLPEFEKTKSAEKTQDTLNVAIAEFNKGPLTPELVTETFQTIWKVRGEAIDQTFDIAPCDRTKEELAELAKEGKRVGYLPQELATQKTRHLLGQIYPEMQSRSVKVGN